MPLTIGANLSSLRVQRNLGYATQSLARSLTRLSSGLRINTASDDAAGLAVASRLGADSRVYGQAIRNINDGISAINVAEGSVSQFASILTRLKELATQSASGSLGLTQRRALQAEGAALTNEYNRLIATTRFGQMNLLNGTSSSLGLQLGYGTDGFLSFALDSGLRRSAGTLGFIPTGALYTGGISNSIALGDFNNDGKLDMVEARSALGGGNMAVYRGNGSGGFGAGTAVTNGFGNTAALAVGDLNNDGYDDIVSVAGSTIAVNLANPSGGFIAVRTQGVAHSITSVTLGDVNGDGNLDVITGSSAGTIHLNLGTGTNVLGATSSVGSTSGAISSVKVGDFNGDSKLDIAAGSNAALGTFLGNGAGAFSVGFTLNEAAGQIGIGDFNQDGLDDIAYGGSGVTLRLSTDGGGYGTAITVVSGGGVLDQIQIADANNDGYLDILSRVGTAAWGISAGNGQGSFAAVVSTGLGSGGGAEGVYGDLNGDGVLDGIYHNGIDEFTPYLANTTQLTTLEAVNLASRQGALDALEVLEEALARVTSETGVLGSALSRLEHALEVVTAIKENSESARARIVDADIAQETANLTRTQILQNTAAALLGQANQQPSLVLQLLSTQNDQ
ncbi:MAG: FG-GAP-like repeat-containing protein [Bdellovibrionota bacterium]|nr:MAG: FG-GAP-like repeat-containing protein [Bdellovibrionota bacterium]